jgi:hypothetical protein
MCVGSFNSVLLVSWIFISVYTLHNDDYIRAIPAPSLLWALLWHSSWWEGVEVSNFLKKESHGHLISHTNTAPMFDWYVVNAGHRSPIYYIMHRVYWVTPLAKSTALVHVYTLPKADLVIHAHCGCTCISVIKNNAQCKKPAKHD